MSAAQAFSHTVRLIQGGWSPRAFHIDSATESNNGMVENIAKIVQTWAAAHFDYQELDEW